VLAFFRFRMTESKKGIHNLCRECYGPSMHEELEVLEDVVRRLDTAGIPYMLSGSVAMNVYAQPRMTRDIDIVLVLAPADVARFLYAFQDGYIAEEETVREEVRRCGMFNLLEKRSIVKIDCILQKEGAYDAEAFSRRLERKLAGFSVKVIAPEDLILRKLIWARESHSELQFRDVRNLLEMSEELDRTYLDRWIRKLGLGAIFKAATGDASA
jgi:3-phosphoglycerate kinase